MSVTLQAEWVERTVLGAVRVVDGVTGGTLPVPVALASPGLSLLRKSGGVFVVLAADGLGDLAVDVVPSGAAYLPRRFTLRLPRDPDPAKSALPGSIFQAAIVPLSPAPAYPATGNLALLRVTVRRSTDGARVGGAVVRLRTAALPAPGALSMTDATGEALVAVPGVPLTSPGPGATVLGDVAASLDVMVDPALASFTADADLDAARAAAAARAEGFIDPDDIVARIPASSPAAIRIAAGRTDFLAITWVPA